MASTRRLVGVVFAHLVVVVTGCYEPELRDCTVQCSAPTDCTGGQVCRADGWCAMPSVKDCPRGGSTGMGNGNEDTDNSNVTPDAAARPDAPSLCQLGCTNGSCVDGVCVIDCSAASSCQNSDVTCPPNLPCRVLCGHSACKKKVQCAMATSCEVRCAGDYSCQDDIVCNAPRCSIECLGIGACKKVKCDKACACDVSCLGPGSCSDPSDCSEPSCRLGEGCSSLLAGCNDC